MDSTPELLKKLDDDILAQLKKPKRRNELMKDLKATYGLSGPAYAFETKVQRRLFRLMLLKLIERDYRGRVRGVWYGARD